MEQNRKRLADELTAILKDTRGKYAGIQERDRMEQARAGAERIDTRRFAFSEYEAEARELVGAANNKALGIIDAEIKRAGGALVEAPSAEAANYCAVIAARDDLTADEVEAALSKYRDHASQKAVRAAAYRSGLKEYAGETEAETYIHDLRSLRADVAETYNPISFGNISDGYAAITAAGYKSFADNPGGNALDAFAALGSLGE